MNKLNYKILFIVSIAIVLSANSSSAFTPLSDLCTINCANWTLYNKLASIDEVITTDKEIARGLLEEYNITLKTVYYLGYYNSISQLDFEIQGNEFPTPVIISSYNYGNFSNSSGDQKWTNIVFYETNSCPTFDMEIDYFVVNDSLVRWDLYVNHYKYELVYVPTPTPITPTPTTPTPTPQPNVTSPSNYTNYTYNQTANQEAWTAYSNNTVSGWNNSIDMVFSTIDSPIKSMRTGIQSLNTSLSEVNSSLHMNLLVMFVPTIIGAIPAKLQAVFTFYLVCVVILIVLGRS